MKLCKWQCCLYRSFIRKLINKDLLNLNKDVDQQKISIHWVYVHCFAVSVRVTRHSYGVILVSELLLDMTFVLMFKNCTCLLVRPVCCCCSKLASISIWIKRLKFCRDESSSLWVVEEGLIHIRSRSNTLWSMLYSIEKHWEVGESRSSIVAVESMRSWGGPQSYPFQIRYSSPPLIYVYSIEKHWEVGESRSSVVAVESMSSWRASVISVPDQILSSSSDIKQSQTLSHLKRI